MSTSRATTSEGASLWPTHGDGSHHGVDEAVDESVGRDAFRVHLTNFEGPFDLLLGLISKHKMDVTEVALSARSPTSSSRTSGRWVRTGIWDRRPNSWW